MELFLNLFWVLLALPAYWILRRCARDSECNFRLGVVRGGLVLGCMLMLLFPFVSATDDLHAMRPDTEESNGKCLRDGGSAEARISSTHVPVPYSAPALVFGAPDHVFGRISHDSVLSAVNIALHTRPGRAPPALS